jgi:hypothetical protein
LFEADPAAEQPLHLLAQPFGMKDCTVSMVGQDGRTYEVAVEATSLFDAAARALEQWSRLWWYRSKGVCRSADGRR